MTRNRLDVPQIHETAPTTIDGVSAANRPNVASRRASLHNDEKRVSR